MDVGGPQANGLGQDLVHEANDGGIFRRLIQIHVLIRLRIDDAELTVTRLGDHGLDTVGTHAEKLFDRTVDVGKRGQTDLKVFPGGQT